MNELYRKYLIEGAAQGSRYSLSMRHGLFEGAAGIKLGARSGNSLEFMEHRDYMPGDDLRSLDWNVYARTEKLAVKMYREEINPKLDLIIDGSASMLLENSDKIKALLGLSATLGTAALNSSYLYRTWLCGSKAIPVINGSSAPANWDGIEFEPVPTMHHSLLDLSGRLYYHGVRILISDLLWPESPRQIISRLSTGASALIVIQLLADHDVNPPAEGNIRLVDSETGEHAELHLDETAVRKYRENLARHQDNWQRACREHSAFFFTLTDRELLQEWDMKELIANEILQVK